MFKISTLFILGLFSFLSVSAQTIKVSGFVKDYGNNQPIANATVKMLGTDEKAATDTLGAFVMTLTQPGFYTISAEKEGFQLGFSSEMLFTWDKSPEVIILLEPAVKKLGQVDIVRGGLQARKAESPVGAQSLSIREIERNPGGNRDISKIVQSLPGVISIPGFRNDIIVRGGSPLENKFYLDGIEIPVINHFQTQGSTGGPVGILNVNFIKDVNFYTGAFPVNLANGLSAVIDFKQMEGNLEKPKFRFTLGSSDLGFTADGPLGKNKKTTFIASARQSYLQGLFSLLKLPFLPNFIDYQAKVTHKPNAKNEFNFILLGAVDFFRLNENVNKGVTDSAQLKSNKYILGYLPDFSQWNYTIGGSYTYYGKSKHQVFLSRNMLSNNTKKYKDNDESDPANKLLEYKSTEEENKLRYENSIRKGRLNVLTGGGFEFAQYTVSTFNRISTPAGEQLINFSSNLNAYKYGVFGRLNYSFTGGKLISGSIRFDGNAYNKHMANPINQPSISLSGSIPLGRKVYLSANVGQFHQIPSYSLLGYRNSDGSLANKDELKYLRNRMVSGGLQYNYGRETKITFEGFYKRYANYPVTVRDSISLGNLGADFAIVGNEPVRANGTGEAYGTELLVQRRSKNGLYGIASYTLAWSRFTDKYGKMVASAWDSRHTLSLTGGKKLKKNWEIGFKWRLVTGRPFTPVDTLRSLNKANWDITNQAVLDINRLNTGRLSNFNQFDIRIDKVWYFRKSSLNLYLDIQNLLNSQAEGPNTLIAAQNADGTLITDPNNPQRYKADFLQNSTGNILPTIGIIFDF